MQIYIFLLKVFCAFTIASPTQIANSQMPHLLTHIRNALDSAGRELTGTASCNRVWTEAVKKHVALVGKLHRYYVCSSAPSEFVNCGEWLYDLTWLKYMDDHNRSSPLASVELALESEWGKPLDVLEDFQKLVQSRATTRVMVFQARNDEQWESICRDLIAQTKDFARSEPGDTYLLSAWREDLRRFQHRGFATGKEAGDAIDMKI